MRAGLVALVALLGACRPLAYVGSTDEGSTDGRAADVAHDDAGDAGDVRNEAVDIPDAPAPEERRGIGGRGLAVTYDGVIDDRAIRFVYVGDDGALHVERRDSETLSRQCDRTFPAPTGFAFVSAPTAPVLSGVVLVAAREAATGLVRVLAMTAQDVPSTCGSEFSPLAPLPDAPPGRALSSAPSGAALPLPASEGGPRVWAVALADDGALLATEAPLAASPLRWEPWSAWPPLPAGERALAAPVAQVSSGRAFQVSLMTESPVGRRRFLTRIFDVPTRTWTPAWEALDHGGPDPDSGMSSILFRVDPRYVRGSVPYGAWRFYRTQTGAYWAQVSVDRPDALPGFAPWANVGNPFADRGIKPDAPVIAPRRNAREAFGELLVLSTPAVGPRVVRYTSTWSDTLEDPPGRWREAPDPLR